ncbi:MAG: hypothetical protein M3Y09_10090 [Actinomycetota bacterium]|nr:hypothetical protein [Actinomycetota bacterium]
MWARAPSLELLEKELTRLFEGCAADDVLGMSHSAIAASSKQSGGIWGGASQTHGSNIRRSCWCRLRR